MYVYYPHFRNDIKIDDAIDNKDINHNVTINNNNGIHHNENQNNHDNIDKHGNDNNMNDDYNNIYNNNYATSTTSTTNINNNNNNNNDDNKNIINIDFPAIPESVSVFSYYDYIISYIIRIHNDLVLCNCMYMYDKAVIHEAVKIYYDV